MNSNEVIKYLEDIKADIRLSSLDCEISKLQEKNEALEIAIKEVGAVG